MSLIEVTEISKVFRRKIKQGGLRGTLGMLINPRHEDKVAVDQINFRIEEGEIIGYIGPNGAGKSTTIKMLAGILTPTSGSIRVAGLVPYEQRSLHARNIGVVFGQRTHLWWDVPVLDSLELLRDIYKVPDDRYRRNIELFNELLALKEIAHVPVRQLSLGQRVRADIAAALLHDPAILFLDEPTIGVDMISKDSLRGFIREVNRDRRVTVLLTTHDMNEIERLCPRVIIIDMGRILYDGSIENIRRQYSVKRVLSVEFEDAVPDFDLTHAVHVRSEGRKKWYEFDRHSTQVSDLIAEISAIHPVSDLTVEEQGIEEVIKTIYQDKAGKLREAG